MRGATPFAPASIPVLDYALQLSTCLCEELATNGAGPTCWCGLVPGLDVAMDHCNPCGDTCGMGYVRIGSIFPYGVFPGPTLEPKCTGLAWQLDVGAFRCFPVPEDGEPNSPEVMLAVTVDQARDAWAMYRAITCCDAPLVSVQGYQPIGPMGGCVGGFWTIYMTE